MIILVLINNSDNYRMIEGTHIAIIMSVGAWPTVGPFQAFVDCLSKHVRYIPSTGVAILQIGKNRHLLVLLDLF